MRRKVKAPHSYECIRFSTPKAIEQLLRHVKRSQWRSTWPCLFSSLRFSLQGLGLNWVTLLPLGKVTSCTLTIGPSGKCSPRSTYIMAHSFTPFIIEPCTIIVGQNHLFTNGTSNYETWCLHCHLVEVEILVIQSTWIAKLLECKIY